MISAPFAIIKAFYDELSDALGSSVVGVYDHVPQAADSGSAAYFPYVVIDSVKINQDDTDTELGFDALVTIKTFTRKESRQQCNQIQSIIYNVLHYNSELFTSDFATVACYQEFSDSFTEPDGQTRQGVNQFRLIFEPVEPAEEE